MKKGMFARMCGRFTHLFTWEQLHRLLQLTTSQDWPTDHPTDLSPRFNVAPMQSAPVVVQRPIAAGNRREVNFFRWGLVPFWAKDESIGNRTINARSETVTESPAFRAAIRKRRCIVPVSGFYEWQKSAESEAAGSKSKRRPKQPWYITPARDELFAFAGLWEEWTGGPLAQGPATPASPLRTFTILTTHPNEFMAQIHDRMPVILRRDQFAAWLDPAIERAEDVTPMLVPCDPAMMKKVPVGTWVNSPGHDDAKCVVEVEPMAAEPREEPGLFG